MEKKLAEISKNHQLLVISHLPQISVLSDTHFIISKETVGDITLSKVLCANYDEKVMEISRLIGGANINETTIRHLRNDWNCKWKKGKIKMYRKVKSEEIFDGKILI